MADQRFPESTAAALIFNKYNKLFLMKSEKWSNKYVVPGGHVEVGESLEEALIREVKEETGLDIYDIKFINFYEFINDKYFHKKWHFIFFDFACRTDMDNVTLNDEGHDHVWVTLEEAKKLDIEPFTLKAIEAYQKKYK